VRIEALLRPLVGTTEVLAYVGNCDHSLCTMATGSLAGARIRVIYVCDL
jgi:hypothetical protein